MTIIATDGKSMAGDGLSRDGGGMICSESIAKVRRLKDGRVMGVAGTPYDIDAVEIWLNEGGDFPEVTKDHFDLLVLERNGDCYGYNDKGRRSRELLPTAIGSGTDLAVGAMEAGASPRQAVEIACRRHDSCGGEIIEFSIRMRAVA